MKKTILIKTDGTYKDLTTDTKPTLEELQKLVDGYIEVINGIPISGRIGQMIVDDEGAIKGKPINAEATRLYHINHITDWPVRGDVVLLLGWRL